MTKRKLNKAISAYNDLMCCLKAQQKKTLSIVAELRVQQCMDTGAATSRTNAVDTRLVRLERKSKTLRKEIGMGDQKICPLLLAHRKAEADAARLATAALQHAWHASHAEDIAAGLTGPNAVWTPVTSRSEGKQYHSRSLPSLPSLQVTG